MSEALLSLENQVVPADIVMCSNERAVENLTAFAEMCEDALYTCQVHEHGLVEIDWASSALEAITGYNRHSINATGGLINLVHSSNQATAQQQLQTVLRGESVKVELHLVMPNGRTVKISHHLRPETTTNGNFPHRIYGVIRLLGAMETVTNTNEERLAALVRAIPEAITITDAEGVCLEYYPGQPESLYPLQDNIVGLNLKSVFADNIVESVKDALERSLLNNRAERLEFPVSSANHTHWYESSVVPFGNGGILSITRNITERKQSDAALRLSEERNRALLQAIPDMMFLVDQEGYYLDVHFNGSEDLLDPTLTHIGKHTRDMVPSTLAERFLAANRRVLESGTMEIIEYELDFAEGKRFFEARIVPCGCDKILSIVRNITEREKSEAALRASEEQNRALLQAIPDLMLLLREDGEYLAIHTSTEGDLFANRAEMLGHNVKDYVSESEFARLHHYIRQVVETNHIVIHEFSHYYGNDLRHFESRIVPCGEGKVLSITRNITEQKLAEQQLRLQNALLQAQLNATPEGILAVDRERKWIGVNQQFIRMWKLSQKQIEKRSSAVTLRHVAGMVSDSETFLASVENAYAEPTTELFDEVSLKDGRIFERRSRPILDTEQHVLGRIWFYRDVTQERKSESLLRAAEAEYRALFENMPIGIYRSLPDGHQLRANPALVQLNGYSSEAEQLANVNDIATEWYVEPDRRDEFKKLLEQHGEVHQFESEIYRHKSRDRIWISEDAILVRDSEGKVLYYEGTVQDITQRKRAEEAIRSLNEQLQIASRLKDEFLKNISHEFRTPLTVVLTLSESLLSGRFGAVNEQQKSSLQRIQKQSHSLLEMVNKLLEMATFLSGSATLHRGPVSLSDLCVHVIHLSQEAAERKQITIAASIDPNVKTIEADEGRLGQIVQILVNNAIRFTPAGGKIGIEVEGIPARQQVQLVVWDTGIKLHPEDTQRLFQPFAQVETTLSRRHEDAGLGMALAAHLTELHNGTIIVENQAGQGVRFIITLPWNMTKSSANRTVM